MTRSDSPLKAWLRRASHGVARLVLRFRATSLDPKSTGTTLVLAPHQDDDVLGCGGLIAMRRLGGRDVHVAYVTDGSASHVGHPSLMPTELAALRETEARAALRVLGVESTAIHFLRAVDGTLDHLSTRDEAVLIEKLTQILHQLQPAEILLPAEDDGSSEHEAAFRLFRRAYVASGAIAHVREFAVWTRWSPRLLAKKLLRGQRVSRCEFSGYEFLKKRALAAHRSQTEPTAPWTTPVLAQQFSRMFLAPEEFFFDP